MRVSEPGSADGGGGKDLGAADDGGEGALRVADGALRRHRRRRVKTDGSRCRPKTRPGVSRPARSGVGSAALFSPDRARAWLREGVASTTGAGAGRLRHLKVVELLLEEEAGDGRGEELGDASGRGVGAVGGAEGVVDVEVERGGELLRELLVVLLLLGVEADVLEQAVLAVLEHARASVLLSARRVKGFVKGGFVKFRTLRFFTISAVSGPMQSLVTMHGLPMSSARREPHGAREYLSSGPPLGRPR